jgi:hypothetical protein
MHSHTHTHTHTHTGSSSLRRGVATANVCARFTRRRRCCSRAASASPRWTVHRSGPCANALRFAAIRR